MGDCRGFFIDFSRDFFFSLNEDTEDFVFGILEMGGGVGGLFIRVCIILVLCLMFIGRTLGCSGGGGKGGEGDFLFFWDLILLERGVGGVGKLGVLGFFFEGLVFCFCGKLC